MAFNLASSVAVAQVTFSADAPGIPDFQGSTLDGVAFTYPSPGVYAPTAQVTDTQGRTYTAATLVQVLDIASLDAQLKAVWNGFKDAIKARDFTGAGKFLHQSTRVRYQSALAQLSPATTSRIDQILTDIQLVETGFGGAQYEMLRQGPDQVQSFAVWFMIDSDGIWRLRKF